MADDVQKREWRAVYAADRQGTGYRVFKGEEGFWCTSVANAEVACDYLNNLESEKAVLQQQVGNIEDGVRGSWLFRKTEREHEQQVNELSEIIAQKYEEIGKLAQQVEELKASLKQTDAVGEQHKYAARAWKAEARRLGSTAMLRDELPDVDRTEALAALAVRAFGGPVCIDPMTARCRGCGGLHKGYGDNTVKMVRPYVSKDFAHNPDCPVADYAELKERAT